MLCSALPASPEVPQAFPGVGWWASLPDGQGALPDRVAHLQPGNRGALRTVFLVFLLCVCICIIKYT